MNDKIRTIIVDDDPVSIEKLSADLKNFPEVRVIETATTVEKARKAILDMQPDLLFLDVEMPGMSGIDLLREIQPDIDPGMRVIFHSAHDKYMRNAMLISDFDYFLLKPYLPEELSIAIKRVQMKESKATIEQLLQKIIHEKRFALQTVTGIKVLTYNEVVYFEFPKNARNWQINLGDKRTVRLRSTVTSKDILAITPNFVQINQRCIVNIIHLSHIENKTMKCTLNGSVTEHEISPKYYKAIKEFLSIL